ncbi:four helix bundle protein [Leyella stercorea]
MNYFYFKKLDVYNYSKELVKYIYLLLKKFPKEEEYALCNQLRRAVISVPSNIAEGFGRASSKEKIHFIDIAYGSLMEVECQIEISAELGSLATKNNMLLVSRWRSSPVFFIL